MGGENPESRNAHPATEATPPAHLSSYLFVGPCLVGPCTPFSHKLSRTASHTGSFLPPHRSATQSHVESTARHAHSMSAMQLHATSMTIPSHPAVHRLHLSVSAAADSRYQPAQNLIISSQKRHAGSRILRHLGSRRATSGALVLPHARALLPSRPRRHGKPLSGDAVEPFAAFPSANRVITGDATQAPAVGSDTLNFIPDQEVSCDQSFT